MTARALPADEGPEGFRVRRLPVLGRNDLLLWGTAALLWLAANVLLALGWLRADNLEGHAVVFLVLSALLLRTSLNHSYALAGLLLMRRAAPPPPPPSGRRVAMATTFVPGLEPFPVLEQTLEAMVRVRGAHDSWVLDEGDDPQVKALAARLGARHFSRKGRPEWNTPSGPFKARTKYGNVNAWLDAVGFAGYDVLVELDTDFAPEPGCLERTAGYFEDPSVGWVQGPPEYRNLDSGWIARGAWEQDHYNKVLQLSLNGLGAPLFVGCHNASRIAALRQVGGFADHEADDALVTRRLLAAGWTGVFVPEVLSRGLAPEDLRTYCKQQYRWAHSLLNMKLYRERPLLSRMAPLTRFAYALHGTYYLDGLFETIGLALACWMLVTGDVPPALADARLATFTFLPYVLVQLALWLLRRRWYILPAHRKGIPWRSVLTDFAARPFYLLAAFKALVPTSRRYLVTRKDADPRSPWPFLVPNLVMGVVVASFFAASLVNGVPGTGALRLPVALWLALDAALAAGVVLLRLRRPRAPKTAGA